jgi:hypothetical protein
MCRVTWDDLPQSQEITVGPYFKPDQTSPQPRILFL